MQLISQLLTTAQSKSNLSCCALRNLEKVRRILQGVRGTILAHFIVLRGGRIGDLGLQRDIDISLKQRGRNSCDEALASEGGDSTYEGCESRGKNKGELHLSGPAEESRVARL